MAVTLCSVPLLDCMPAMATNVSHTCKVVKRQHVLVACLAAVTLVLKEDKTMHLQANEPGHWLLLGRLTRAQNK